MDLSIKHSAFCISMLAIAIIVAVICICTPTCLAYAETASGDNGATIGNTESKKASLTLSKNKKGLIENSKGLYYYEKGKKVKSAWKTIKGKKYYFNKDGMALKGLRRVKGLIYLFDDDGVLYHAKGKKFIERGKYTYLVTKKGQVLTDWQLHKDKLYHFSKNGRMDVSKTVDYVKLNKKGKADNSNAAKSKKLALEIIYKIVPSDASRSTKLWAAWNYVVSGGHFRYSYIYPNMAKKKWQYDTAHYMLKYRRGNCFSFACAFAQLAQVIGYENVSLGLGRVRGSTDGAADGFTRHAWVKVENKYYDPELRYAHSAYVYGTSYYPLATKSARLRKF